MPSVTARYVANAPQYIRRMGSFTVTCECGEQFHGDDGSAGRRVRCRRCDRIVELEPPPPPAAAIPPARPAAAPKRKRRHRRGTNAARFVAGTRVRRALDVIAWGYLAATLLIALAMWTLGDRWWPATILVFMGRWVFLLPLAALIPAALVLRRRLLIPLTLGAAVTLGPIMGMRTGWRRLLAVPDGMPLRVVAFNVEGGRAVATELPLLLEAWHPDVVLFQECGEELATATERMAGWHAHHDHGLCMLSRFPIASAEPMDRSTLERVKQDAAGVGGAGYVVRYALTTPRGTIGLANLHLETPRKGFEGLMAGDLERLPLNTALRDIESNRARRWVDGMRAPTIVAGDFNTPVESRIFQQHWGDLTDAFSQAGRGLGFTKYNGWIRIRIDHVLADQAWWRVAHARVGDDLGSDHRPLIVDLVLVERG
jgi:vancomycin resistance protein VanJ